MSLSVLNRGGGGSRVTLDGERVKELAMTSYQGANPYTMGQDGMTIEANTLIKNALQIVNGVSGEGQYVWKQLTAEGGDFVAFVTADDENYYPEDGELEGYYYKRFDIATLIAENIREGVDIWGVIGTLVGGVPLPPNFTKFAVNEFTPSSRRQRITAYHDLGEEPKVMYMVANSDITKLSNSDVIYLAKVYGSGYASLSYRESTATDGFDGGYTSWLNVDSEKIETVQGMDYYFAKVPYFILTMA